MKWNGKKIKKNMKQKKKHLKLNTAKKNRIMIKLYKTGWKLFLSKIKMEREKVDIQKNRHSQIFIIPLRSKLGQME